LSYQTGTKKKRKHRDRPTDIQKTETKEGTKMKKFGFATIAATGLAAAVLGFAAPAQAAPVFPVPTDVVHHEWVHDIQQQVNVPQVDTSVRTRGSN
jgi:phosphoribosylcarboxyaminoimidazole (NCAIR) mutase